MTLRTLLSACLLLLAIASADAASKTRSVLMSDVTSSITSNAAGQISGTALRTLLNDMVDSMGVQLSANTWNDQNIFNDGFTATIPNLFGRFVVTGTANDFVTDDYPQISAAILAATTFGGGTVYLQPKPYWSSLDIVVPKNVTLKCVGYAVPAVRAFGPDTAGIDYGAMPCGIYFTPGHRLANRGEISGIGLFPDFVHFFPVTTGATRAEIRTFLGRYVGTGIGLSLESDGSTESKSIDVMLGGWETCTNIFASFRVHEENLLGDCTTGSLISTSHDVNRLNNITLQSYLTADLTNVLQAWVISAIADNGAGLWRLTLSAPTDIATGEVLYVNRPLGGGEGIGGQWTVTSVDATHVDLQGSAVAPTTTGDTTLGYTYIPVASTANLQPGMTVSGAGIPAGATIGSVWRSRNAISLDQSHPATATAVAVALTFGSNAYTPSSAAMYFDGLYRSGPGFYWITADGSTCANCFSFGHRYGALLDGTAHTSFTNFQSDLTSKVDNQNNTTYGIYFNGAAQGNTFSGSILASGGTHVFSAATGSHANTIIGFNPISGAIPSNVLEVLSGGIVLSNFQADAAQVHNILIDNSVAPQPVLSGNNIAQARIFATDNFPKWWGAGNNFGGLVDTKGPTQTFTQTENIAAYIAPTTNWFEGSSPTDEKYWRALNSGGVWYLQAVNDAYSAANTALLCDRTGATPTGCDFKVPLTLSGATSGGVQLKVPAVAGSNVLTFPAGTTDFSATGGANQVVQQGSAGGAFTVGQLAAANLSDGNTGTGAIAHANSPTLVTPNLGERAPSGLSAAAGTLTATTPFTLSIPNLKLWFDASCLVDNSTTACGIVASGAASQWTDLSGNANHATQSTGSQQPTLQAAAQNGLNTLRFTAVNTQSLTLTTPITMNDFTVISVKRRAGPAGVNKVFLLGDIPTAAVTCLWDFDGKVYIYGNGEYGVTPPALTTNYVVFSVNKTPGMADAYLIGNHLPVTLGAIASLNSFSSVGAGSSGYTNGEIAEMFVFDRILSRTEREAIEMYLAKKWNANIL